MANRISVIVDVVADKATKGFSDIKKSISDAEGSIGKLKAGSSAAFGAIKANAALALAGAGTAIAGFVTKGVADFQNFALEAGHLSEALGMPVEEASRLIEVAGDVGVGVADLESTIGRMNRVAAATPGAFDAIGAAIVRNEDGTVNVNETFLETVDALNQIPDATERAEAAQKIFGRSWQNIAELVAQGGDEMRESLAAVSDEKVITPEEVEKARKFRDSLDNLSDTAEDLSLKLGQSLVPALTTLAQAAVTAYEAIEKIVQFGSAPLPVLNSAEKQDEWDAWLDNLDALAGGQESAGEAARQAAEYMDVYKTATTASSEAQDIAAQTAEQLEDAEEAAAEATRRAAGEAAAAANARDRAAMAADREREAVENLRTATVAQFNSSIAYEQQVIATTSAVATATNQTEMAKLSADEQAAATLNAKSAILQQAEAATQLAVDQAAANGTTLSAEQQTANYKSELAQLASTLAPGSPLRVAIDEYIAKLNAIPTNISTRVTVEGIYTPPGNPDGNQVMSAPMGGSRRLGGGSGTVINLTVNAGMGADGNTIGRQIVEHINRAASNGLRINRGAIG